jgi:regulator of protease activity HflC (stomatin/prohibitin superfamily)
VVALVAGIVPSFFVSIPEGSQGLLVRRGRYSPIRSGTHVFRPGIGVSHIVTTREIPFDAAVSRVVTSDDVRVDVDILLTFRVSEPERFVYAIASRDFDQVFQGTCQEAVRRLVRGIAIDVLDCCGRLKTLNEAIGAQLAGYGVVAERVLLTHVAPPAEFVAFARRDASPPLQQLDRVRLAREQRRQSDRESLARQRSHSARAHEGALSPRPRRAGGSWRWRPRPRAF